MIEKIGSPFVSEKKVVTPVLESEEIVSFRRETTSTLNKLPTNQVISKNPDNDFHTAPPELMEASAPLGRILDAMKRNPALVTVGMEFYKTCASNTDLLIQIRAVCLRSFRDWSEKTNSEITLNGLPYEIEQLASYLPKTRTY